MLTSPVFQCGTLKKRSSSRCAIPFVSFRYTAFAFYPPHHDTHVERELQMYLAQDVSNVC